MSDTIKYLLSEQDMPKSWYNINADLPVPLDPVLHPGTKEPIGPDDLAMIFPRAVIEQEMSTEREIEIPTPVRDVLRQWRPSPLYRARRLEKALQTPARIYYKYEGVSPAGSHKPNTAIAQAFYNKQEGVKRITTETGAGQWGSALALAGAMFGLDIDVFMVKVSFQQKPYRRAFMESFGATCIASPSETTRSGRSILAEHPDSTGSLGIAISEAVEAAVQREDTKYALGSVLNHVLLHQTVIGLEAKKQLASIGEYPDVVIGCAGGGSNFAGLAFPFVLDKINGTDIAIHPVEPMACPTMTRAPFVYDHGDTAGYTPLLPMHSLGHGFVPPPIHAGGLRYHGMAPTVSQLVVEGIAEPKAVTQTEAYEAGMLWARTEGYIPAPETNNALAQVVKAAVEAREEGKEKVIVASFSGHGLLDLGAYDRYLAGELQDVCLSEAELTACLESVECHPKPGTLKCR
jgi:tryptophan synthase beta chain